MAPETSQRCQADRAAVEAVAKDIVDAGAEHSTVLGQNDVILGDCQWIRTGSLAFIDEDFEVVDIAGLELHIRVRTIPIDQCGVVIQWTLEDCQRPIVIDAIEGTSVGKDI